LFAVGLKDRYVKTVAEIESLHNEVMEKTHVSDLVEVTTVVCVKKENEKNVP
jgi:hypothetical protein